MHHGYPTEPDWVRLAGENQYMCLHAKENGSMTMRASYWRVLLWRGPRHRAVLVQQHDQRPDPAAMRTTSPSHAGRPSIRLVPFNAYPYTIVATELTRAVASLRAAELCLREGLENSAASRAYYAMFQAAQVRLEAEGLVRSEWSYKGMHTSFNQELIQRRKLYPRAFRDYLTAAACVARTGLGGQGR